MNTKRQTVWLVSMLSLMVVLSAYYLFTQDVESPDLVTDNPQTEQGGKNATEASTDDNSLVIDQVQQPSDDTLLTDEEKAALEQVEEQGYTDGGIFSELAAKQDQQKQEETDQALAAVGNVLTNPDEGEAAAGQLSSVEEKYAKISELEEELEKQYQIVVIDEENDKYNVVVSSEKLERSEAAAIMELVMAKLELKADQISVQYEPQA
ncbi:SpoIIIAH-like family protein [Paenibacillus harenae]|uniref:SpoIIIAH-like family protein n=1 Tax=Paenibacillus harenae TaxID=306543 RepID=UPI002791F171|nr:SpoIIIAH-like family protein [Paenibacillus harenae]MDQ0058294.1 stage III sporulation protein AH [Paenibacillus harenae]